ncbi:hypothetical protein P692DRAFT_20475594 [Suillus brevipes Sb2]|nr:hypothetical protein P692DRAFT_20475594 [Suillus brevipes Sb2]
MSQHHSEELELPVLGQTYTPGQAIESFIWTVTVKTTKANLHEKLKSYDRPTRGNRTELLDRLRQFSNDRDEWLRCVTGMCAESVLVYLILGKAYSGLS